MKLSESEDTFYYFAMFNLFTLWCLWIVSDSMSRLDYLVKIGQLYFLSST